MYLYLNTVLTKVFAIVFVFEKFIVFIFVFKYYAMYLDPSLTTINKNIPQVTSKSQNHLPWLNCTIRKKIQKRKQLYNKAKSTGTEEAWSSYLKIRNEITKEISEAHKAYQEKLFDCDINSSHKNFWRYIRSLCRDNTGVAPLKHQNSLISNPHDKAKILNRSEPIMPA